MMQRAGIGMLVFGGLVMGGMGAAVYAGGVDRVGWQTSLATYFHQVSGEVTVVDAQTIRVDHFTFDGGGPAVYFYLGTEASNPAFAGGLPIGPQLTRPYNDETVMLTLPPGETVAGYGAISVWCAAFDVDFGSGAFAPPPLAHDGDGDGDVDSDDQALFEDCASGPAGAPNPMMLDPADCIATFDADADGAIDLADFAEMQIAFSDTPAAMAEYRLTFDATWSLATHPDQFPPNPHFSGLIGGTHTHEALFWDVLHEATAGIESMAETGSKTALTGEVQAAITAGTAGAVISGGGIGLSPGSVSVTFTVTPEFSRVTVVSMIAPSPDWFVGVASLPLLVGGRWVDEVTVPLAPYDAGTDSGASYTSANQDTNPAAPIVEITGPPLEVGGTVPPLGTFTFERLP